MIAFRTDCVAILLATYNGERFLSQQLDSIINQSCTNWELFIHDDGSSDLTCEIIKEYVSDYPNQIHYTGSILSTASNWIIPVVAGVLALGAIIYIGKRKRPKDND